MEAAVGRVGRVRWRICALLFWATTLSYIDRQVLGVLAPSLGRTLGWTQVDYGYIVTSFQAAYGVGLLFAGTVIDRLGTRLGYALSITVWALAAASQALTRTVLAFAAARFVLGLGEAGNFPAAIKTVAEWFPRRERALAAGIFNAGTNVGAVVAPLAVPIAVSLWGLRSAFLLSSVLSALWLVTWLHYYRPPQRHPAVSARELDYIGSRDPQAPAAEAAQARGQGRVRWLPLLRHPQTWAFAAGKFLTDPVWWFLLFWLPKFLYHRYGLNLTGLGPPLVAIYLMADIGSVLGGWIAGRLMRAGWSANAARKSAMLICALAVVPVVLAPRIGDLWGAVAIIGLATAAHQGWEANLLTLTSDLFPSAAVASVVGLGGFAGAVSGALVSTAIGYLLQATGNYALLFAVAGCMYPIALAIIHALAPKLAPAALAAA
ncbi:MAG TPA: MFS transporter [Steroidobacteraceae bacterium]|nr:MFS transporter [Steroidobacteraceae bacterium]